MNFDLHKKAAGRLRYENVTKGISRIVAKASQFKKISVLEDEIC